MSVLIPRQLGLDLGYVIRERTSVLRQAAERGSDVLQPSGDLGLVALSAERLRLQRLKPFNSSRLLRSC
jgi:hypothetical protein